MDLHCAWDRHDSRMPVGLGGVGGSEWRAGGMRRYDLYRCHTVYLCPARIEVPESWYG